ncbi:MAG: 30S ribosomal protein S17 [Patescibacteria group bacterium]|jgi:small subunit ribosomal protein S17
METATPKTRVPRSFSGVVTANAMTKTIVVRVDRILVHPKYGKRYRVSKKYHVHAEQGTFPVGTKVQFVECRPYSKTVRWRVLTPTA